MNHRTSESRRLSPMLQMRWPPTASCERALLPPRARCRRCISRGRQSARLCEPKSRGGTVLRKPNVSCRKPKCEPRHCHRCHNATAPLRDCCHSRAIRVPAYHRRSQAVLPENGARGSHHGWRVLPRMRRICRSDDTEEPSRETTASMAPISRALHIVPQITGAFSGAHARLRRATGHESCCQPRHVFHFAFAPRPHGRRNGSRLAVFARVGLLPERRPRTLARRVALRRIFGARP